MSNVTKNEDYGKFLFCGLDLHDKSMVGAVSVGPGKVFYVEYSSGTSGVDKFIEFIKDEKKMMECTGVTGSKRR